MAEIKTADFPGVELLRVGKWKGQGCPDDGCSFTVEILDEMVRAHKETVGELDPPVKLGHDEAQRILQEDGLPAAGWIHNLRRSGDRLLGDLVKVPEKIAELIRSQGYRKRSAEIRPDMEIGGKKYPWVFTGLALLGADLPAVEGLADIRELYHKLHLEYNEADRLILFQEPDTDVTGELKDILEALDRLQGRAEKLLKNHTGAPTLRQLVRAYKEGLERVAGTRKMAEWTTAIINDLPDSAFAYVAPGGDKNGEGKTIPRSLRFLPHHGPDGDVDMPHLRNAMSRLPQTNMPAAGRRTAMRHLLAHARAEGVGEHEEMERMQREVDDMTEKELRALLGLDDDANVMDAIKELKGKTAVAGNGDMSKQLSEAQARILKLEIEAEAAKVASEVDEAIKKGKLLPKQREEATKMAMRDRTGFTKFIETQPVLITLGEQGTGGDSENVADLEPTPQEVAVAKSMGVWSAEHRVALIRQKAAAKGIELPENFGKDDKKN